MQCVNENKCTRTCSCPVRGNSIYFTLGLHEHSGKLEVGLTTSERERNDVARSHVRLYEQLLYEYTRNSCDTRTTSYVGRLRNVDATAVGVMMLVEVNDITLSCSKTFPRTADSAKLLQVHTMGRHHYSSTVL